MKIRTVLTTSTLGLAGLVAAGLMAMPGASTSVATQEDRFAKRDEDTAEVVLVADDDDDDTNARDDGTTGTGAGTNSRSRNDGTGTGAATGRDDSRERRVVDMTNDGPGVDNRDRSARHTNDRSRRNTRR